MLTERGARLASKTKKQRQWWTDSFVGILPTKCHEIVAKCLLMVRLSYLTAMRCVLPCLVAFMIWLLFADFTIRPHKSQCALLRINCFVHHWTPVINLKQPRLLQSSICNFAKSYPCLFKFTNFEEQDLHEIFWSDLQRVQNLDWYISSF